MKCQKCSNELFTIKEKTSCDDCPENAAWDDEADEYIFDEKIIEKKKLARDHVEDEGECNFDTAYGEGCWMVTCTGCGTKFNSPKVGY